MTVDLEESLRTAIVHLSQKPCCWYAYKVLRRGTGFCDSHSQLLNCLEIYYHSALNIFAVWVMQTGYALSLIVKCWSQAQFYFDCCTEILLSMALHFEPGASNSDARESMKCIPALHMQTSMRPCSSIILATAALIESCLVTSSSRTLKPFPSLSRGFTTSNLHTNLFQNARQPVLLPCVFRQSTATLTTIGEDQHDWACCCSIAMSLNWLREWSTLYLKSVA